jgi:hypothetical protein
MKLLKHMIFFKINFTVAPLAKQLSGLDFCLSARDLTGSMFQPQTWLWPKTQLWLNALLLYQDPKDKSSRSSREQNAQELQSPMISSSTSSGLIVRSPHCSLTFPATAVHTRRMFYDLIRV